MTDAKARLLAEMQRVPAPTRASLARRTMIALGVAAIVTAVAFIGLGGPTLGERHGSFLTSVGTLLAACAAFALFNALSRRVWRRPAPLAAIVAPVFALGAIVYAYAHAGTHTATGMHNHGNCACLTLVLALPFVIALLYARRGTQPVRAVWPAVLLSTTSVAIAATLVFLICPAIDGVHFAIAHLASAILIGAVATAIGLRILRA